MKTQTLNVSLNNAAQNLKLQNMLILAVSSSPNQLLVFKQSFFFFLNFQDPSFEAPRTTKAI